MGSMWANVVIAWSRSRKLALAFVRFGPFGSVSKARRPTIGVVGHQPQLATTFFIANSTLDPMQRSFVAETGLFQRGENCPKKVTQNLSGFKWRRKALFAF